MTTKLGRGDRVHITKEPSSFTGLVGTVHQVDPNVLGHWYRVMFTIAGEEVDCWFRADQVESLVDA